MLDIASLKIKLILFNFEHFVEFKILPNARNRNLFLSIVYKLFKIFVLLFSISLVLCVAAFYISLYLSCGIVVAFLAVVSLGSFIEINKELWGGIISLTVAGLGLFATFINHLLTSKKGFSEHRENIYIQLINFLQASINTFSKETIFLDIPNLSEVIMFSSNVVLKQLNKIKKNSAMLKDENDKNAVIHRTMFLIDYMRSEIRDRGFESSFYDYKELLTDKLSKVDSKITKENEAGEGVNLSLDKKILTVKNVENAIEKKNKII